MAVGQRQVRPWLTYQPGQPTRLLGAPGAMTHPNIAKKAPVRGCATIARPFSLVPSKLYSDPGEALENDVDHASQHIEKLSQHSNRMFS